MYKCLTGNQLFRAIAELLVMLTSSGSHAERASYHDPHSSKRLQSRSGLLRETFCRLFRGQRATCGHLSWHLRFTSALTVETVKGIIKFSISCRANFEVNTCLSSASYWLITDNMQPTKRAISEFRFTSEPEKAYATQPLAVFCCIWGDESIRSKPYAVSMLMINDNGLGPSECLNEPGCALNGGLHGHI
jgi:hypothetical protein